MTDIKCFLMHKEGDGAWRHAETGEVHTHPNIAAGAMWFAPWYAKGDLSMTGPDGNCLIVQTPGGQWIIDSRANNCTRRDDNVHKCWVRHGTAPNVTVDKNGDTCAAGAGSILCGSYHGFLRNGYLVDC